MTEHISFVISHATLVPETPWILDHGAAILSVEFYNISSIAEPDNARCSRPRVVCPHPELAHPVNFFHQRHSYPGVAARVRNREPGQYVVIRATRDDPALTKHPIGWQRKPPVLRQHHHR